MLSQVERNAYIYSSNSAVYLTIENNTHIQPKIKEIKKYEMLQHNQVEDNNIKIEKLMS